MRPISIAITLASKKKINGNLEFAGNATLRVPHRPIWGPKAAKRSITSQGPLIDAVPEYREQPNRSYEVPVDYNIANSRAL